MISGRRVAVALLLAGAAPEVLAHGVSELARQRMLDGGLVDFALVGAEHMLTGYDHLLFLLGVLFFLKRFVDILLFITAFTVGHTLSLVIATPLGIGANPYLIDAVIALTVIYKAVENLGGLKRWFGEQAPRLLPMVFFFGIIHGFGLSTRLQQMTLAKDPDLISKVLAFNVGVELGQVAALAVMLVVIRLWRGTAVWPRFAFATNVALAVAGGLLFVYQIAGYTRASAFVMSTERPPVHRSA